MTVSLAGTVLGASLSTPALGADQPPALPEHMECAATPGKPLHNVTAEDIAAAEKTLETHQRTEQDAQRVVEAGDAAAAQAQADAQAAD